MIKPRGRGYGAIVSVFVAVVAVAAAGCVHDECEAGQARCEDHIAWSCGPKGGEDASSQLVWQRQDCGPGACAADDHGSFCALESAPNAACATVSGLICAGTSIIECRAGYVTFERDCTADAGARSPSPPSVDSNTPGCASGDEGSFCVPKLERDPACARTGPGTQVYPACSGNDTIDCAYGYSLRRTSCNGLTCTCNGTGSACTLASCVAK